MGRYKQKGDVLLSTAEVAMLLGVPEREVVYGLQQGAKVKGVTLPEPVSSLGVTRHFHYQDVIAAIGNIKTSK